MQLKKKNPHAVILGRRGGKAGVGKVKARTSEQARKASLSRWQKYHDNQNTKT